LRFDIFCTDDWPNVLLRRATHFLSVSAFLLLDKREIICHGCGVSPTGSMMMDIAVSKLLPISNIEQYKIHFAVWNKVHQPLDVFVRDRDEMDGMEQLERWS
jgi:hypothetical protein